MEALRRELGGALEFSEPPGGMALWARCAPGVDALAEAVRRMARVLP